MLPAPPKKAALGVLVTAYLVEALPYVNLWQWLGWQHSGVARIVLGRRFEWANLLSTRWELG